jgi:hypothetical protein
MMLIGFAGPAGCGKDTAGRFLIEEYGFEHVSFAAPLKRALEAMGFPTPQTQDEKEAVIPWLGASWRHLAQTLGTEWGRSLIHPDLWVMLALRGLEDTERYVFTDVRFENEAAQIRRCGGLVVHIRGRAHAMTEESAKHASEQGLSIYASDYVLSNSGSLKHLQEQVSDLAVMLENRYA